MNAYFNLRSLTIAFLAVSSIGLSMLSGCKPATDETIELLDTKLASVKIDDLSRTMDFVFSDKRFDQDEFVKAVTLGANRWVRSEPERFESGDWSLDELAKPLIEQYSDLPLVQRMSEMTFTNTDPYYLQQSAWLNKIAGRISADKNLGPFELFRLAAGNVEAIDEIEDPLAHVMAKLHDGLSAENSVNLANGLRAFDWVIRNIQLEEAPEPSDDELAPGVGYKRYPWQVLIYSRADFVERAKVFMLLAEQMGLETVMLYVGEGENAKPWCPALLVENKLYLFDSKLGLPIPSERLGTIATLTEIKANPGLLEQLNLTTDESLADDTDYWVKPDDLKSIQGLVYTSPEHCSKRMYYLEKNLSGNYAIKLSSRPSQLVANLPEIDGLTANVWDVGFRTHQFRQNLREAIAKSKTNDVIADKIRWHFQEESYIDEFSVYRTGRARYFNGRFEVDDKRRTAIESFFVLMYSDKEISDLGTDTMLQRQLGIRKGKGDSAAQFQLQVKGIQQQMRLVRRDSGFFLAQCHFDNGNFGTAANWLERMLNKADAERWQNGVEYLLGRALEARGEYDRAIAFYKRTEDAPQTHGNRIRARMLGKLIENM